MSGNDTRKKILSHDVLSVKDFAELLGVGERVASDIMKQIKEKQDRLRLQGRIHIQDYIDFFKLDKTRY